MNSEKMVKAIADFPKPANLTDYRTFIGMVNQMVDIAPALAGLADHLHPLKFHGALLCEHQIMMQHLRV